MGRPPKFTRGDLQTAALAIVQEEGLAALTMRSLAQRLGTGPMTLYNHVSDRADLDLLVVDAVMSTVELPKPTRDWRSDVAGIALAMWRAARAYPSIVPLILTRRSRSLSVLDTSEALLHALSLSGRSGQSLLVAFRAVTALVTGFAQGELSGPLAVEPAAVVMARVREMPSDGYPHLVEMATTAADGDIEAEFRQVLDLLLDGLSARQPGDGERGD